MASSSASPLDTTSILQQLVVDTPSRAPVNYPGPGVLVRAEASAARTRRNIHYDDFIAPTQAAFKILSRRVGVSLNDAKYKTFRQHSPHVLGWCWDCLMPMKESIHPPKVKGQKCPHVGLQIRVGYLYFIGDPFFEDYPNAPPNLSALRAIDPQEPNLVGSDFCMWLGTSPEPDIYDGRPFINLHHLFLWTMRKLRLIQ
ncbi:hypothetical protein CVT26_004447 [Gymnopilus dilepis]|uniref:Uncharacterized protein n=1 Tax=Gymnopilus dilepis TaxID=231916 RepID=A0A409XB53_9AGAR|nr:hypothetical protein CVT26_004447 [Gymnopilus dilepis]